MLDVRPFRPEDYVAAVAARGEPEARALQQGRVYVKYGAAFSGFLDGAIVGCAGLMLPWPGLGEAWAILTPLGRAHGGVVHRAVLRGLRGLIRTHGIRRLQADVIADFAPGCAWMTHLGFHREGLMPAYGPGGETFVRYAWLHPELTP
jgi:RimJ/RimL family protein N-acetyltransferase